MQVLLLGCRSKGCLLKVLKKDYYRSRYKINQVDKGCIYSQGLSWYQVEYLLPEWTVAGHVHFVIENTRVSYGRITVKDNIEVWELFNMTFLFQD